MNPWLKRSIWLGLGLALVVFLVRAFQPSAVLVDAATVRRGALVVTVDDDGRTRVRERYTISAPVGGQLLRTALRPGDEVRAEDTLVAEFVSLPPAMLDARTRLEAEARLAGAEARLREAEAREELARANEEFAERERERLSTLAEKGIESAERAERAVRDARSAQQALQAETFAVQVAEHELELARASLLDRDPAEPDSPQAEESQEDLGGRRMLLRSPISGTVLRVFEESARALPLGTPILEVGNTEALEIVAEYLSQDAVQIRPGMPAWIEGWGGEAEIEGTALAARVRRVEPGGFKKTSALGVEEQRVNVILDPADAAEGWKLLGDGYRVEVRVVLWEKDDVLIVPTGALFRDGEDWSVLVIEGGTARGRRVQVGRRNGLEAQVIEGLSEGERVVLYPSELLEEGTEVEVR